MKLDCGSNFLVETKSSAEHAGMTKSILAFMIALLASPAAGAKAPGIALPIRAFA
jgi:transposase-like protein